MKLSKGKCRVLSLGKKSLRHWDRLETDSLQSILAVKDLGVMLDIKLTVSPQRWPLSARAALSRVLPPDGGRWLLLSAQPF